MVGWLAPSVELTGAQRAPIRMSQVEGVDSGSVRDRNPTDSVRLDCRINGGRNVTAAFLNVQDKSTIPLSKFQRISGSIGAMRRCR